MPETGRELGDKAILRAIAMQTRAAELNRLFEAAADYEVSIRSQFELPIDLICHATEGRRIDGQSPSAIACAVTGARIIAIAV
jgi:hypothetical protein